jgi:hypothetical protein
MQPAAGVKADWFQSLGPQLIGKSLIVFRAPGVERSLGIVIAAIANGGQRLPQVFVKIALLPVVILAPAVELGPDQRRRARGASAGGRAATGGERREGRRRKEIAPGQARARRRPTRPGGILLAGGGEDGSWSGGAGVHDRVID